MAYYLGVDQGSHSSRAVLYDDNGEVVINATQKVSLSRRSDGCVEYDANHLLDSVSNVIHRVLSELDQQQLKQISACGIACQRSTVLAWDVNGNAISPALSWQDVRARTVIDALKQHEQEIMQLTGLPITPYYSAGKMNWLLNSDEAVKQCARDELRISPLISFLIYHLLENRPYRIDFSNAQRTLLFDLGTLTWSQHLCDLFGIDVRFLPGCAPMSTAYGRLRDTRIPVMCVCGDQNAAMFGSGPLGPGEAMVNIGSGAFVLRELDQYRQSTSQLTGIAYADEQEVSYMREATINGAGNALSWAEQQWQIDRISDHLPEWLEQVQQPPVFINAIGGLGTPWMQGGMQSSFIGDGDFSSAEKAVAIVESIVFMIQVNLELMAAEVPLKKLRVSGGLSNLDGLCQRLSSLSGLEVERTDITEATARGAAWLAAGRPQSWSVKGTEKDNDYMRFMPKHDAPLQARYKLFKCEVERLLDDSQAAGLNQ